MRVNSGTALPGLVEARFLARRHRFLVRAEVAGGRVAAASGDPGRRDGILRPGAPRLLEPALPGKRRMACTATFLRCRRKWMGFRPARATRIVESAIPEGWVADRAIPVDLRRP